VLCLWVGVGWVVCGCWGFVWVLCGWGFGWGCWGFCLGWGCFGVFFIGGLWGLLGVLLWLGLMVWG
ncbi:hypothetical protein RA268_28165, partial [Pseudomonas syringae pv. tagetis]